MNKVEFSHITLSYGENVVVRDFSLSVKEGEIVGIVGPSGCGKTTLMRSLCGLKNPDSGEIFVGGVPFYSKAKRANIPPEKRNIGIVFQDYAVWPHLTVAENVAYPLKKKKTLTKEQIEYQVNEALSQVSMEGYEKYMPSQLSGGQQQRVAIARALTSSKDLIIMDEPITNLDAKLREGMLVEIRLLQQRLGSTVIYVTHDQEAALQLCDRVVIMDQKGNINQIGTDEEIIEHPANQFVFKFIGVSNFIPVIEKNGKYCLHLDNDYEYATEKPSGWVDGPAEMGIRPMDMIFDDEGLVEAKITQGVFLGNMFNFFVKIGDREYRLQRSTLDSLSGHEYKTGDTVHLRFVNEKYYPIDNMEANHADV
jgi:iron(III) transport system ATP-binding protein